MKNKIIYLSIAFSTFLLGACEKSLDLYPPGAISENIFWKQEKDAVLAVNAVYRDLQDEELTMVTSLDGITDLGYVRHSWTDLYKIGMGIHDPLNAEIALVWTRYYRGIRKANDVILNAGKIPKADPELIARVVAEARFLRAYFYTNLTGLWGDVPLLLEPLAITDQIAKTSKSEIVAFINKELDEVANVLPESYSSSDIGRATKGAALALKARVCLWNGLWSDAAIAAKGVMDLNVYHLYPNYGELFTYAGENSSEIILSAQYAKGGLTHQSFEWGPYSIGGSSVVEPVRKLFNKYEHNGAIDPNDPYKNLDPRWGFTAYYPGSVVRTENGSPVIYNSYPYASNTSIDKVNTQDNTSSHGWNVRKYIDYTNDMSNQAQGAIDFILIRYADVLLMYAEAKIESGEIDQSVYDAINEVRTRPSVEMPEVSGLTPDELKALVRNERAVELAFEGLRLFDLNRWKTGEEKAGLVEGFEYEDEATGAKKIWSIGVTRHFQERDYLWPIPQREIDLNKNIVQNTGW